MKINNNKDYPTVGMGATIKHWSDRTAATVIQVTKRGKQLVLQEDKATRTDTNGMSESQTYEFEKDTNGKIYFATMRKDGQYRILGGKELVVLGQRYKYHDYSF
jgi:hypothetical protein